MAEKKNTPKHSGFEAPVKGTVNLGDKYMIDKNGRIVPKNQAPKKK